MNALKGWAKKWDKWCAWHKPMRIRDDADGVAYEEDAERRLKRKQLQMYCADCHHWMWSHEWGDKKKSPAKTYQA